MGKQRIVAQLDAERKMIGSVSYSLNAKVCGSDQIVYT